MASGDEQKPLHVLFFPFMAPGHLIPVADMAAIFASRGVKCSILTTPANAAVILNHSAVGGFVTHCGWNSVLEALSAGVPLVTWPRYYDQFYNEKLIVEVLKVGVGIGASFCASKLQVRDEVINGEKIAEGIDGVMGDGEEAEAIKKRAVQLREKARSATEKGGSSYDDVGRLINELMARRCNVNTI